MLKILKIKSIMILITVVVIGGVSIKSLSMFKKADTTIKKFQDSNIKGNYINDVILDSKNTYKDESDRDLNSLSDAENLSDNSQYNNDNTNNQEIISSNLEKTNNNTNEQIITSLQLKESSSNINTENQVNINNEQMATSYRLKDKNSNINTENQANINEQITISSPLEDVNSNVNTENQEVANTVLEIVKVPTIDYDRTTSIYANDNITLLRVEYYVNNKLTYYSVIEQFDDTTKSYVEKIYQCNRETNIDPLIRTDIYFNGNLTESY